jgi:hypothetical protein
VIVAAGLLVLAGLGAFVAGVLTGVTALFWACVGACVVAALLLSRVRRQLDPAPRSTTAPDPTTSTSAPSTPARAPSSPSLPVATPPQSSRRAGRHSGELPVTAPPPATGTTAGTPAVPPAHEEPVQPVHAIPPVPPVPAGAHTRRHQDPTEAGEPPVEEVEVTDLLLVVDLTDEVLVVDEHPRYHVAGCSTLAGRRTIPLPMDEARMDGFTPCGVCRPDATMAARVRARR